MLAVFNGICGTKVNTCHTVCAAFAPNRLAVLKLNVVQHTAFYAFSASYANRILFLKDGEIFTEIHKGSTTRKAFFEKILDVLTMMGGGVNDVH